MQIDTAFIESSVLQEQSSIARTILDIHCKERAIEDLILALREKDMPVSEMLKLQRGLAKKQFKLRWKIKKLLVVHQNNLIW